MSLPFRNIVHTNNYFANQLHRYSPFNLNHVIMIASNCNSFNKQTTSGEDIYNTETGLLALYSSSYEPTWLVGWLVVDSEIMMPGCSGLDECPVAGREHTKPAKGKFVLLPFPSSMWTLMNLQLLHALGDTVSSWSGGSVKFATVHHNVHWHPNGHPGSQCISINQSYTTEVYTTSN